MNNRQSGLTLVELMVTLAVAIVLLAVGVPLFTGVAANNRAAAQANSLVAAVKLARSEAVKRGTDVGLAATDGLNWADGYTVFEDADNNGVIGPSEPLRNWGQLSGATVGGVPGNVVLFFDRSGNADAARDFNVTRTDSSGPLSRCVSVMITGQVRMRKEKKGETWSCP